MRESGTGVFVCFDTLYLLVWRELGCVDLPTRLMVAQVFIAVIDLEATAQRF